MIVGFYNNKGGVGKTTLATNTALEWDGDKDKVLYLDFDGQKNSSSFFGLNAEHSFADVVNGNKTVEEVILKNVADNVDVIGSHTNLNDLESEFAGDECGSFEEVCNRLDEAREYILKNYSVCIVDFPPVYNNFTKLLLWRFCDTSVFVANPSDERSIAGVANVFSAEDVDLDFCGLVWNGTIGRKGRRRDIQEELQNAVKISLGAKQIFNTQIPLCDCIHNANATRQKATTYWNGKQTQTFKLFVEELKEKLNERK